MRHVRRWNRSSLFFAAFTSCALAACAQEAPGGIYVRPEEVLAERLKGFGGFFYDDEGVPTLLLKADDSSGEVGEPLELTSAELARAEKLLIEVYGEGVLEAQPRKGERPMLEQIPHREVELRVITARYSFAQLNGWANELISSMLTGQDAAFDISVGMTEGSMFVMVPIPNMTDTKSIRNVERLLRENGIPRDAVIFEQETMGESLDSNNSPPSSDDFSP